MKLHLYIAIVLLAVLSSCQPHPTSPQPSPGGEGVASRTLENIDSLMWRQPDSAFAMLQEFASSAASDSLDEFNGHYCQVLVAELLFKNYYKNNQQLLQKIDIFATDFWKSCHKSVMKNEYPMSKKPKMWKET